LQDSYYPASTTLWQIAFTLWLTKIDFPPLSNTMQDIATASSPAASLIGWWHDAGVDILVDEVPTPWLERGKPVAKSKKGSEASPTNATTPMPDALEAFADWLIKDLDIPEAGDPSRRIAASGMAGAPLMILIDMPEAGDHQRGALLSGESGALFDNMLKAIGQNRSSVYTAALCPGRPATGLLPDAALPRLAEIARHHIALSVPKRLWLLGGTVSRALLGVDDVASAGNLHEFNHKTVNIVTVASFAPRFLLDNPAQKARAWADIKALIKGM
jgi:DNA polymerase